MNLHKIAEALMVKRDRRTRIGWVDWSSDSWDRRECMRRADRIWQRVRGKRTNHWGDAIT